MTALKIGKTNQDYGAAAIIEALTSALSDYPNFTARERKVSKAVARVAKSIASDSVWAMYFDSSDALINNSSIRAFFDESAVALLLDSVFCLRPVYQKESRSICFSHWVEACNPLVITNSIKKALMESFAVIYKKIGALRDIFKEKELRQIASEIERRLRLLNAGVSRIPPEDGSFAAYVKEIAGHAGLYWASGAEGAISFARGHSIPFVERDDELLELTRFCFSDRRLSWWSLSGAGGTGKSRLALELCRLVPVERNAWYCVFLPAVFFDNIGAYNGKWDLDKNLLVIVDSPGYYSKKVGLWIKQLIESDTVNRKIRILILERSSIKGGVADIAGVGDGAGWPTWLKKMMDAVDVGVLSRLCYNRDFSPLDVAPLNRRDYVNALANHYADNQSSMKISRILRLWGRLDPGCSDPSVLNMIINAADDKISVEALSYCTGMAQLLDVLYEHDVNGIMSATDIDSRAEPSFIAVMLCLSFAIATGAAELKSEYVYDICKHIRLENSDLVSKNGDLNAENVIRKLRKVLGQASGTHPCGTRPSGDRSSGTHLSGTRPSGDRSSGTRPSGTHPSGTHVNGPVFQYYTGNCNIFCIYFALKSLEICSRGANGYDRFIINLAWFRRPYDTANFISRAIEVCLVDEGFAGAVGSEVKALAGVIPKKASRRAAALFAELQVCYSTIRGGFISYGDAAARLESLRNQGFKHSRDIAVRSIKTLYNLLINQDGAERKDTVKRMENLRNQGFEQDREIALILAKSMFILTSKQDEQGVRATVARLEGLRDQGFEADRDITLELVKSLLNLTAKQSEPDISETVARIEALRNQGFESDRDIAREYATALFNLTTHQDADGVRQTVARLEGLRDAGFTDDGDITLRLVQALFGLTTKKGADGRREAAARIEALRGQGFEQDREIALTMVKSLYNLSIEQDAEGAMETVGRIEEISSQGFANDGEIRLLLAKALLNLTTKLDEDGMLETVSRLETLRNQGPNE